MWKIANDPCSPGEQNVDLIENVVIVDSHTVCLKNTNFYLSNTTLSPYITRKVFFWFTVDL